MSPDLPKRAAMRKEQAFFLKKVSGVIVDKVIEKSGEKPNEVISRLMIDRMKTASETNNLV